MEEKTLLKKMWPVACWFCVFAAMLLARNTHCFWGDTGSLLLLGAAFGGLGSLTRITNGILNARHRGETADEGKYVWDPLASPPCASFLSIAFVLLGFADLGGLSLKRDPVVVAAWSSLIGLFFPQALGKMREVSAVLFTVSKDTEESTNEPSSSANKSKPT